MQSPDPVVDREVGTTVGPIEALERLALNGESGCCQPIGDGVGRRAVSLGADRPRSRRQLGDERSGRLFVAGPGVAARGVRVR